ncbi:MAG: hypothetical protein CL912_30300 [Deltaproteobacteria bacterium]|nr:hypothetical protein [Deltaproteobacteria bacterium]
MDGSSGIFPHRGMSQVTRILPSTFPRTSISKGQVVNSAGTLNAADQPFAAETWSQLLTRVYLGPRYAGSSQ